MTELLARVASGNRAAIEELVPVVYRELRRIANLRLRRERPGHTLQATALVHEAYLRLIDQRNVSWQNRAHFFGVSAHIMRQILLDHAKASRALKRGGGVTHVTLDETLVIAAERADDIIALEEALGRLETLDLRQARVVELRFYGGLTVEETAEAMGISPGTVKREWAMARAWLHSELSNA